MTCREVDLICNARLDAARANAANGGVEAGAMPAELSAHLGRCPSCRSKAAGFAALARAIGRLEPPPPPTADLTARILAAVEADGAPATLPLRSAGFRMPPTWRRVAVAAAVLLTLAGIRIMRPGPGRAPDPRVPSTVSIASAPARPLPEAVADAAEATVAIARKTTEPAVRLGREVFGPATSGDLVAVAVGPTAPLALDQGTADRLVKVIGEGLEAGVRPLSRPTRSAFGFLLPNLPPADDPQPPGRGA